MDPFKVAERYLQLKKVCAPKSMGDTMIRINEMILSPLISLTFLCLDSLDLVSIVTAAFSAYRVWREWLEYCELRFTMQHMYLTTMATGGPQIVTNDPEYLPYVYADAVVRASMRRPDSGWVPHQRAAPWTRIRLRSPVLAPPPQ
jgi:hypothetical protein